MVRAKFWVEKKDETSVHLRAVYSGSKENDEFFEATPNGTIELEIVNSSALEKFKEGEEYYVDFTPASS